MNINTGREFPFPNSQDDGIGYPDPVTGVVDRYPILNKSINNNNNSIKNIESQLKSIQSQIDTLTQQIQLLINKNN